MAITTVSGTSRYVPTAIKLLAMKWLFTTLTVTQPTAPFTLRVMGVNGDATTPGTEQTGDLYTRGSFSFGAAGLSGNPQSRYGSYLAMTAISSTSSKTIAGFEYWDSAGTPIRIARYAGISFSLNANDFMSFLADSIRLSTNSTGVAAITYDASLRVLDWLTGRSATRPSKTTGFTVKLVTKDSGSTTTAGTEVSGDLYAAATGVTFSVAADGTDAGMIVATNDADIVFAGISSTAGKIVWGWEVWDSAGLRVAWQQIPTALGGYLVTPGCGFKIPAGALQLVAQ